MQYQILTRCVYAYRGTSSFDVHLLARILKLSDFLELQLAKQSLRLELTRDVPFPDYTQIKLSIQSLAESTHHNKFSFYFSNASHSLQTLCPSPFPCFITPNPYTSLFITGCGPFNSFIFKISRSVSPTCDCGRGDETSLHLLINCPRTHYLIAELFHSRFNPVSFLTTPNKYKVFTTLCKRIYNTFLIYRLH